jgi:hypothetical protein
MKRLYSHFKGGRLQGGLWPYSITVDTPRRTPMLVWRRAQREAQSEFVLKLRNTMLKIDY